MINIEMVSESYLPDEILGLDQIKSGRLNYSEHKGVKITLLTDDKNKLSFRLAFQNVTCVCFSPDGTALGTATDQGEITFFSISFDQPAGCR